jgi:hypothetical protein
LNDQTELFPVRVFVGVLTAVTAVILLLLISFSAVAEPGDAAELSVGFVDLYPRLDFDLPVAIVNAGDDRLFIVEQPGKIWVVKGQGTTATKELFLDIGDRVQYGGERGLLGLAFHPRYEQNGFFYVNYVYLEDGQEYTAVSRFTVSADRDLADKESENLLLTFEQPYGNHNGGDLQFDPQGMLVIATGDGGSGNDPDLNSQNPQNFLGKLLRIDVDKQEVSKNYAIPDDNPFIGEDALDEIWTLGLRNPWRFSFDRLTGDLFIGDVGQREWEEINYVQAVSAGGQNFEWSIKEGFADFKPDQDAGPGVMTKPIFVYGHDEGCSVTGGFVYRGVQMRDLDGVYFYADYCRGAIKGLMLENGEWKSETFAPASPFLSTFGEDKDGELYFAIRSQGRFDERDTGRIYRLQQEWRQQIPLVMAQ